MNAHEFLLKYEGRTIDVDHYYGGQCWDCYAQYCIENGIPYFNCTSSNYVKDIWNNRKYSGILNYMDEIPANAMQDGDVAIWTNSRECPDSHIAIFRKNNANGTGIFLGQNQRAGQVVSQENFSYNGIMGALRIKTKAPVVNHKVGYKAHIQDKGWTKEFYENEIAGTQGESKRLEALVIDPMNLKVSVKVHMQDYGWKDYGMITKDTIIGTVGESKRLEAICLNCTNARLKYRVHIQDSGWTAWTIADGISTLGSVGMSQRIEAIQMTIE